MTFWRFHENTSGRNNSLMDHLRNGPVSIPRIVDISYHLAGNTTCTYVTPVSKIWSKYLFLIVYYFRIHLALRSFSLNPNTQEKQLGFIPKLVNAPFLDKYSAALKPQLYCQVWIEMNIGKLLLWGYNLKFQVMLKTSLWSKKLLHLLQVIYLYCLRYSCSIISV